jgi:hypothetical protein
MAFFGFYHTSSRVQQILDNVPENELLNRTKDLPEVKAYLQKYPNAKPYVNTDFHVGVTYDILECELAEQDCGSRETAATYLDIVFNSDTGYPMHSIFWCHAETGGKFAVGDKSLIDAINNC